MITVNRIIEGSYRPTPQTAKRTPPQPCGAPRRTKTLSICKHEGHTISLCSRGEDWHLRQCLSPESDVDSCRRNGTTGPGEGRCSECSWHSRHEVGSVRHLLYFICPIARNGVWQWNVEQLLKGISLFNGRKIVAIVTGPAIRRPRIRPMKLDPPEMVQAMLPGCEFLTFENNPGLGEVVAWDALWSKVLPGEPGDVTFYAHAKGVKHGQSHPTVQKWSQAMYDTCLDWPAVHEQLKRYPVVGTFKKTGRCFLDILSSAWHYSGTYFWARNSDFAARDWRVPPRWAATEALPGMMFRPDEAGCLLHEQFGTAMNLYSAAYWQSVVEPVYRGWKAARNGHTIAAAQQGV